MLVNNDVLSFGGSTTPPANASINSTAQWAWSIIRASFQLSCTGTAAGTIQLQASDDKAVGLPANQFQPTNWNNVGSSVTVAGSSVPYLIPYQELCYEYLRIVYTDSSGGTATGTFTIRMKSQGL